MIPLDKEKFCDKYQNEKYKKKKLVYACYKDLFEQGKPNPYIIEYIENETKIVVGNDVINHIKASYKKLPCNYNPLWRNLSSSLQMGNKVDVPVVQKTEKLVTQPVQNTQTIRHQMPEKLPDDYVRLPHNFKEKRYHESLKNYTFDYPWHQLDSDGVPEPVQVGRSPEHRLRWLLDLDLYNEIKESYIIPDDLKIFKQKHPSVFSTYCQDGFPHDFGGYHPNNEVFNS